MAGGHPGGGGGAGGAAGSFGGAGGSLVTSGAGGHAGAAGNGGPAGHSGAGGAAGAVGAAGSTATGNDDATNWAIDAAHDNAQPNDAVPSPLVKAWTLTFTGAPSYPLIAGGKVFVSANESQPNVRALSLASGAVVWGPIAIGSLAQLAYDQGRLYAQDAHGNVTALDASTGARLWANQVTSQYVFQSAPVAADGLLWVEGAGEGGTLTAFNGATGKIAWSANTFDGSDGNVAVGGGIVFEAEACDQVSAFTEATGALEWYHSTGCTGGGGTTPAYYNGWVWVRDPFEGDIILDSLSRTQGSFLVDLPPSFDAGWAFYVRMNTVTAVDVQTSTIKWAFSGDGKLCTMAAVAGRGKQVFMGSSAGTLFEIDETSGKRILRRRRGGAVGVRLRAVVHGHRRRPSGRPDRHQSGRLLAVVVPSFSEQHVQNGRQGSRFGHVASSSANAWRSLTASDATRSFCRRRSAGVSRSISSMRLTSTSTSASSRPCVPSGWVALGPDSLIPPSCAAIPSCAGKTAANYAKS